MARVYLDNGDGGRLKNNSEGLLLLSLGTSMNPVPVRDAPSGTNQLEGDVRTTQELQSDGRGTKELQSEGQGTTELQDRGEGTKELRDDTNDTKRIRE